MSNDFKIVVLTIILSITAICLQAQTKENDPYSILGIGNINSLNFAQLSAMPGLSATYHDASNLNIQNPAASGFLRLSTFEAGGFYQYKKMKTPFDTDEVHSGNLSYLALGFSLFNENTKLVTRKKRPYNLGMTISLTPYSRVGYDLQESYQLQTTTVDTVTSTFQGSGGTYKFLWGNSFRYKSFSVGLNIGYLFGKQTTEHWDFLQNSNTEYRNRFEENTRLGGFIWNIGALYEYILPAKKAENENETELEKLKRLNAPKTRITLGFFGNSKNNINTTSDLLYERRQTLSGFVTDVDTLQFSSGAKGKMTLPSELGVGIMFSKDNKWKIGMDYTMTQWSGFSSELNNNITLKDAMRIGFGAEYIPKHNDPFKYGKRMIYRLGGFYQTDPRTEENIVNNFTHSALTFGLGFPVLVKSFLSNRKIYSFVNISVEIGQYGDPNFLKENYYKLNLGFTLNDDSWFFKRKYN